MLPERSPMLPERSQCSRSSACALLPAPPPYRGAEHGAGAGASFADGLLPKVLVRREPDVESMHGMRPKNTGGPDPVRVAPAADQHHVSGTEAAKAPGAGVD